MSCHSAVTHTKQRGGDYSPFVFELFDIERDLHNYLVALSIGDLQ